MAHSVYPYVAGHVLTTTIEGNKVSLEVEKTFPLTMCPVMLVRRRDTNETCILKLFDRRFGIFRRKDKHTSNSDKAFKDYIDSGLAQAAMKRFEDVDTDDVILAYGEVFEEASPWKQLGLDECRFYHLAHEMFTCECRAYQELLTLQGQSIPRSISTVTLSSESISKKHPYLEISGILLESIDGFKLKDMPLHVPEESWDTLVLDAMDVARKVNHAGIIITDAGVDNTMIRRVRGGQYEPVLIDFASTLFRSEYPLDETTDVVQPFAGLNTFEGVMHAYSNPIAIGGVMKKILQKQYEHTVPGLEHLR